MKFTKEDAYKELVGKLTAKGEALNLTDRTAKKFTETLMKKLATEETELSDFINDVYPDFKEFDGQMRKEKSDFVKQWNEEHPETTPPQTPPATPPVTPKEGNGEKSELEKRLEAMELELAQAKKSQKIDGVRASLLATMKSKGINDEEWSKDFISEINITEDFDVEAKAENYLKIFNKSNAAVNPSVTPHSPSSGSNVNNNEFSDIINDVKGKLKREGIIKE